MNDQQWEHFVEKANGDDQILRQGKAKQVDTRLNVLCALISPTCLFLGFLLPSNWAELILFPVWGLGGLVALGVLATFAYTNNVSHKMKEAALSFLLGNLVVFFVFTLKPT